MGFISSRVTFYDHMKAVGVARVMSLQEAPHNNKHSSRVTTTTTTTTTTTMTFLEEAMGAAGFEEQLYVSVSHYLPQ
ncbi:hypothetical protein E2C01_083459 [Portunus trituberculatus]|uniref:Uncharacterized protein n=1 Tax=Portunus trituberculatus TaxID=210409 RepID=A0A5B7IV83_PORTR|nr:hypothetical protein [Portunus trituberculatus]